jgi:hypothetical protein
LSAQIRPALTSFGIFSPVVVELQRFSFGSRARFLLFFYKVPPMKPSGRASSLLFTVTLALNNRSKIMRNWGFAATLGKSYYWL